MKQELISVIMPVYNVEKYVTRAIQSILNQTYEKFELILIDDGSTDKSKNICDYFKHKDNRIKAIHQTNQGVSAARNKGIQAANGDYIVFIDADDEITNNALEIMYSEILKEKVDIVITNYTKVSIKGKKILNSYNSKIKYENVIDFVAVNYQWGPCNKLIKKDKIKKMFDTDIFIGEDALFFVENFKDCKYSYIDKSTYYYYMISNSAMHKNEITREKLSFFDAFEKIISEVDGIAKYYFMMHYIDCFYEYFNKMKDTNKLFFAKLNQYRRNVRKYYAEIKKNEKIFLFTKIFKTTFKKYICDINYKINKYKLGKNQQNFNEG